MIPCLMCKRWPAHSESMKHDIHSYNKPVVFSQSHYILLTSEGTDRLDCISEQNPLYFLDKWGSWFTGTWNKMLLLTVVVVVVLFFVVAFVVVSAFLFFVAVVVVVVAVVFAAAAFIIINTVKTVIKLCSVCCFDYSPESHISSWEWKITYHQKKFLCEVFCVRQSVGAVGYIPGQEEVTNSAGVSDLTVLF